MTGETKRKLASFGWKVLTAIIAALAGTLGVSAATNHVLPIF